MALEMQESLIRDLPPTEAGNSLISVNNTLEDFGLPPTKTMTVIRKCRGYIAGSAVLAGRPNLPRERRFAPKDLDVYIPLKYSEIFKQFLLESGDRHMCRESKFSDHKSSQGSEGQARRYDCPHLPDNNGKEINVIVSSTRSALVPIVAFHSTPVMNFIAYFGVVTLYAELTDRGEGWMNRYMKADSKELRYYRNDYAWIEKYEERGYALWTGSDIPGPSKDHRCGLDEECTLTVRNLFDNGVEVRRFRKYRSQHPTTLLKTLEPCFVWSLRNRNCKSRSTLKAGIVVTVDEYFVM
ncbi:hypothetical protein BKA70DRAFT_1104944 [Coprinopsis sp. MPI-PUGE-AT-0042]|nr:hypothetical protein BKA70DRAFT_1104944 [Coprinopsis sp. MPI-PUGE-AT-0042]